MQRAVVWIARGCAVLICLFIACVPSQHIYASDDEVDLALVLAVDCSFSVDEKEFALQMQGLGQAFQRADVKAAIRHGTLQRIAVRVVEWSDNDNQTTVVPWTIIANDDDAQSFGATVSELTRNLAQGGTSISSALLYAEALLGKAPRATRRVIDLSSDGRNNVGVPVNAVRDRLVANGITINALAILNEWPTLNIYFQNQVAGGQGNFVIPANDYSAYADAIYIKLLKEITGPGIS